jgi:small subunit ribosomal protein S20
MATKKRKRSALKRIRQTSRRTSIKMLARSAARTAVKTARDVLEKGGEAAETAVAEASSILDRAAKRGAIHKNAARRGRSRVAKRANKSAAKKK